MCLHYDFCREVFPISSNHVKYIHNCRLTIKKADHCLKLHMTEKFYLLAKSDLDLLSHLFSVWLIIECWTRVFSADLIPNWAFSIQTLILTIEMTAAMFIIKVIGVWKKNVECFLLMSLILVRVSILGIFYFGLCAFKNCPIFSLIHKIKPYLPGMYTWHSASHQEMWMFHGILLYWKDLLKISN